MDKLNSKLDIVKEGVGEMGSESEEIAQHIRQRDGDEEYEEKI